MLIFVYVLRLFFVFRHARREHFLLLTTTKGQGRVSAEGEGAGKVDSGEMHAVDVLFVSFSIFVVEWNKTHVFRFFHMAREFAIGKVVNWEGNLWKLATCFIAHIEDFVDFFFLDRD